MKKLLLAFCVAGSFYSVAQSPQKMTYQSVVRNASNTLISNSPVGVQISILQESSSGLAVYIERHTVTTNTNGLATMEIGNGTPVSGSFSSINWANGPYYLKSETDPAGGTVYSISATSQLLSVPYALYAETSGGDADSNPTNEIQTLSLAGQTLSISGGNSVTLPTGSGSGGTLDQAYDFGGAGLGRSITTDAGAVQINNTGLNLTALEINSAVTGSTAVLANVSGVGVGLRAESTNASNSFAAIQGNTNSSGTTNSAILGNNSGAGYGVSGQIPSTATGFAAVYGNNLRTTGGVGVNGIGYNGVSGSSSYNQGFGIFGQNSASPNIPSSFFASAVAGVGSIGVQGQTLNGQLPGVYGQNLNSGFTYNNIAVLGSSNTGVGVWGENLDGSFFGVYSIGDLGASGVKTFMIDHPGDPENKYLKHFSIESDEILNVYRGIAAFDENGEAVVELKDYVELVNMNFTYQLTMINGFAPVYIKEKVSNGQFVIAGGQPGLEVSWQLSGERNDPYMKQHPEKRDVEVEKRSGDQGKYLVPFLYDQPVEKKINYLPQTPLKEQK